MDPAHTFKLPLFKEFREKCEIVSDVAWHKSVNIDGFSDGEDALKVALNKALTSEMQSTILLTVSNKTFTIVVDSRKNMALFDSHVHFTAVENEMPFEVALKRKDLQGMFVLPSRDKYAHLAKYVFRTIVTELRADDTQGTILVMSRKAKQN